MSHYNSIQNIQQAFRDFVNCSKFTNPLAVTLTFKQGIPHFESQTPTFERITPRLASLNFRHFMNLLNSEVYGNRFKRHGHRLQVVPVLEGVEYTRLHYHCIIDRPNEIGFEGFSNLLRDCWSRTHWGYKEIDIQHMRDHGWTKYISKSRSKAEFDQSIDWENFYLS